MDEAQAQLSELKIVVETQIEITMDAIKMIGYDLSGYRSRINQVARTAFKATIKEYQDQLENLESLGDAAGVNVTSCTTSYKKELYYLTVYIETPLYACHTWANGVIEEATNNAYYYANIIMTEVEMLNFQIISCQSDIVCLSPILTKIETATIELPQKIDQESVNAQKEADSLKVLLDQCADDAVAGKTAEALVMMDTATQCVNDLIS